MNHNEDKEMEALLRRYRPKGPPDRLRKNIFEPKPKPKPKHSLKTFLRRFSIAAAVALIVGLNAATYRLSRQTADLIGARPLWTPQAEETARALDLDKNGWAKKYLLFCLAMEEQNKRSKIQEHGIIGAIQ
jgi:hypothetical protein